MEANSSRPVHASSRAARCGLDARKPTASTAPMSPTETMWSSRTRPTNSITPIVIDSTAAVDRSSMPMSSTVGAIQTSSGTKPRTKSPM